jgi:integrase/recombinase XerD
MMTFQEYLQEHFKASNHNCILFNAKRYQKYTHHPEQARLQEVLQHIQLLREKGNKPRTLHNVLHAIKVYYRYLQYTKQRADHPCKQLSLKDQIDKSIKTETLYSTEQLEAYFNQTLPHKKLMVSLLVYQGVTVSELCVLKQEDIDIEKAEITINNRVLPLQAKQIYLYLEHQKKMKSNYLFLTRGNKLYPTNEINDYINKSRNKQDKMTPMKIRQSFIKNLLLKNDIRLVQVFAGHRSSGTTEQYNTTPLEELKAQISQIHPIK